MLVSLLHKRPSKMKVAILLVVFSHSVSSVVHTLKYFHTGSSGMSNFPEFVAVGMVDEVQMVYYDSNSQRAVAKQAWMDEVIRDDPNYMERETRNLFGHQQLFKVNMDTAKQRFNQTEGVHIFQQMYGCEWDDEDGTTEGYHQYGYDGEDFIVLDMETMTWIAPSPQAFSTKLRLDKDRAFNEYQKHYLTKVCVDWLKKYVNYGKRTLLRTELPTVSLLQKSPSSPVVCHATGFYPDSVMMFWTKDSQELHENVTHGELLPNHDGTFQMSVDLNLNLESVPPEDWGQYGCVFQLAGVKEDIITILEPSLIRTNRGKSDMTMTTTTIIIIVSAVTILILTVVGVVWYKKKKDTCPAPPGSDNSAELSDKLNPASEAIEPSEDKVQSSSTHSPLMNQE